MPDDTQPHRLEFGSITLHQPPEGDEIPPESVKVFMPASDGGRHCIGFLFADSSMDSCWGASDGVREALAAGQFTTFPDLTSLKQHLRALYATRHATDRRLKDSINTVYERAHELESLARQADNIHVRDSMFTFKLHLDSCRAILELGGHEHEIPR